MLTSTWSLFTRLRPSLRLASESVDRAFDVPIPRFPSKRTLGRAFSDGLDRVGEYL